MLTFVFMVGWAVLVLAGFLGGQVFSSLISSYLGMGALGPDWALVLAAGLTSVVAYLAVKGNTVSFKQTFYASKPTWGMFLMGLAADAAMIVSNSIKGYSEFNAIQAASAHIVLWLSSFLTVLIFVLIGTVVTTLVAESRYSRVPG